MTGRGPVLGSGEVSGGIHDPQVRVGTLDEFERHSWPLAAPVTRAKDLTEGIADLQSLRVGPVVCHGATMPR